MLIGPFWAFMLASTKVGLCFYPYEKISDTQHMNDRISDVMKDTKRVETVEDTAGCFAAKKSR